MASCSSCSSASSCASAGHPGGEGCIESAMNKQDEMIARRLERIRHKIFVMSGKGGVGKSSVTVNVAAALAHRGFKVGIMDVDIHGPSVPNLLGLPSGIDMNEDNALVPSRYNGNLSVISMDSLLQDRNTAILWRGPKKTAAIRQFLSDVAWGDLDFLVIDSPKAINFLHHAEGKLLGVVENMSGLVCPHCHTEIDLFKKGGGKELAARYGVPFLGEIPLDPVTVVSADRGVPVVFLDQESAAKEAFLKVADAVAAAAEAGKAAIPPAE